MAIEPDFDYEGLAPTDAAIKRTLDIIVSAAGMLLLGWLIVLASIAATFDTGKCGFYTQERVGRHGRLFKVIKLRTMREAEGLRTTVTTANDVRITRLGAVLRKLKVDELPQLINVLLGQMSLVGPRPDVPGFADNLTGADRIVLAVRPGMTGPATLKYRDEEQLLAAVSNAEKHNRTVIYPDKVCINVNYVRNWTLCKDFAYLWMTVAGRGGNERVNR